TYAASLAKHVVASARAWLTAAPTILANRLDPSVRTICTYTLLPRPQQRPPKPEPERDRQQHAEEHDQRGEQQPVAGAHRQVVERRTPCWGAEGPRLQGPAELLAHAQRRDQRRDQDRDRGARPFEAAPFEHQSTRLLRLRDRLEERGEGRDEAQPDRQRHLQLER